MTTTIKCLFYIWHEDDRKAGKVPTLTSTQTKPASRPSSKPYLHKEGNPKVSEAKL